MLTKQLRIFFKEGTQINYIRYTIPLQLFFFNKISLQRINQRNEKYVIFNTWFINARTCSIGKYGNSLDFKHSIIDAEVRSIHSI